MQLHYHKQVFYTFVAVLEMTLHLVFNLTALDPLVTYHPVHLDHLHVLLFRLELESAVEGSDSLLSLVRAS